MTSGHWRLFVAAPLPPIVASDLWNWCADARRRAAENNCPVRWVPVGKLHLTFQFLGPTDPAAVPGVAPALEVVAREPAVRVRLTEAGAFPDAPRLSVMWVGLGGDLDALTRLQRAIATALEPLGFSPETRPFHPHVTIGRVSRGARPAERRAVGELLPHIRAHRDVFLLDRVVLFRTVTEPHASHYAALATQPLRTTD